jgi:hypothetical protein
MAELAGRPRKKFPFDVVSCRVRSTTGRQTKAVLAALSN